MALLQKHAGTTEYVKKYQEVQDRIMSVRRDRKAAKSVQAIVDPQARAVRKLQRNEMKKNSKKRKANDFSLRKGKRRMEE
jgi:U3 small nucleolar RNA-associated protein 20